MIFGSWQAAMMLDKVRFLFDVKTYNNKLKNIKKILIEDTGFKIHLGFVEKVTFYFSFTLILKIPKIHLSGLSDFSPVT